MMTTLSTPALYHSSSYPFLRTDLKSVSDDDFVRLCTYYLNVAGQNIADLADRNITVQSLQDNSDLLDNFVYQRQLFIDTKRQHFEVSAQLVKQVKTTNFDLISIDTIMDSLWQTQPVVVGDYYKARNLPSTTSSKLAFKGRVFDSVTGEPLTGAIVTFSLVSANAKAMASGADLVKTVKIKASEGGFQLKTLASGEYTVTVSYYGYTTQEITVYINEGKLTSIAVPLNKLAE